MGIRPLDSDEGSPIIPYDPVEADGFRPFITCIDSERQGSQAVSSLCPPPHRMSLKQKGPGDHSRDDGAPCSNSMQPLSHFIAGGCTLSGAGKKP